MRKELIALLLLVVVVAAFWFFTRPKEEQVICSAVCKYGCITGTAQCREPPPPVCPSSCKLGCIPGTAECTPEVVIPKVKQIESCGVIKESSELNMDLSSDNTCLYIQNDDVLIDCRGHSISGSQEEGSYAIHIGGRRNVTIKDCVIKNYASGILVESSSNVSLLDIQAHNNLEDGILLKLSSYILIERTTTSSNGKSGIELISSTDLNLSDNIISGNAFGIQIESSNITAFSNNVMYSSSASDLRCYYEVQIRNAEANICNEVDGCDVNCSPYH